MCHWQQKGCTQKTDGIYDHTNNSELRAYLDSVFLTFVLMYTSLAHRIRTTSDLLFYLVLICEWLCFHIWKLKIIRYIKSMIQAKQFHSNICNPDVYIHRVKWNRPPWSIFQYKDCLSMYKDCHYKGKKFQGELKLCILTHWGLVTRYGIGDLGQHWFR